MSILEVQALNTVGIDLIEQGNLEEASDVFSHALRQLSWCLLLPTPLTTAQQSSHTTTSAPPQGQKIKEQEQQHQQGIDVYCMEDGSLDPRRDEFFSRAFHFECPATTFPLVDDGFSSQHVQPHCFLSSEQHRAATVCCLFNLGLCHLLEWERQHKVNTFPLTVALSLFEQAVATATACNSSGDNNFVSSCPRRRTAAAIMKATNRSVMVGQMKTLIMAIVANATTCHRELGNIVETDCWNGLLWDLLQSFNTNCSSGSSSSPSSSCYVATTGLDVYVDENMDDDNEDADDEEEDKLREAETCGFFTMNAFLNSFPRPTASAA